MMPPAENRRNSRIGHSFRRPGRFANHPHEPSRLRNLAALLQSDHGQRFVSTPEIGAATGLAFLPGGTVQAAAEPTRRGGGSALVQFGE